MAHASEFGDIAGRDAELTADSVPMAGEWRVAAAVRRALASERMSPVRATGCSLLGEPSLAWTIAVQGEKRRPSAAVLALSAVVLAWRSTSRIGVALAQVSGVAARWAIVAAALVMFAYAAFSRSHVAAMAVGPDPDAAPLPNKPVPQVAELRAERDGLGGKRP